MAAGAPQLLETAARSPGVARIFVNPAIKRALCREAGADRDWLRRIRPWWGHDDHFHLRLSCPPGEPECRDQPAPPAGDGCGAELDWWFTAGGAASKAGAARETLAGVGPAGGLRRAGRAYRPIGYVCGRIAHELSAVGAP